MCDYDLLSSLGSVLDCGIKAKEWGSVRNKSDGSTHNANLAEAAM